MIWLQNKVHSRPTVRCFWPTKTIHPKASKAMTFWAKDVWFHTNMAETLMAFSNVNIIRIIASQVHKNVASTLMWWSTFLLSPNPPSVINLMIHRNENGKARLFFVRTMLCVWPLKLSKHKTIYSFKCEPEGLFSDHDSAVGERRFFRPQTQFGSQRSCR